MRISILLLALSCLPARAEEPDITGPNPFWPQFKGYSREAKESWDYTNITFANAVQSQHCASNPFELGKAVPEIQKQLEKTAQEHIKAIGDFETKIDRTKPLNSTSSFVQYDQKLEDIWFGRVDACKGSLDSLRAFISGKRTEVEQAQTELGRFDGRLAYLEATVRRRTRAPVGSMDPQCAQKVAAAWSAAADALSTKWNPPPRGKRSSVKGVGMVHGALRKHLDEMKDKLSRYDVKLAAERAKCGQATSR